MDADADLEHAADHDDIDVGDYECDDAAAAAAAAAAAIEHDGLVTLTGLRGSCSAASVPPQPQPRFQL